VITGKYTGLFAPAPQKVTQPEKILCATRFYFRCIVIRMVSGARNRSRPLTLVGSRESPAPRAGEGEPDDARQRGVDWSILMAHAQVGERDAYRRLFEEITPYLRSLAARSHHNPSDIEDTVQDVLLTVHAIRHTYDPTRPFGPWLVAIANRRIVDRLRRQGRSRARENPLNAEEYETFASIDANLDEATSAARALREAIHRLPPGQRQAVELLKLKELSLKEASAMTGMSVAALKVASHRAIKRLRHILVRSSDTHDHDA
jgi:RNA polymerase sigma-70 factor (ECF subfamily)